VAGGICGEVRGSCFLILEAGTGREEHVRPCLTRVRRSHSTLGRREGKGARRSSMGGEGEVLGRIGFLHGGRI
jgi:hypothetical protein